MDEVRIVAEIATLCGAASDTVDVDRVVALLAKAVAADAAMLLSWDVRTQRHRVLSNLGYPAEVRAHLAATDTSPEMYGVVRAVGRPLYIEAPDAPLDFRETQHYGDFLHPAGFEDGLTACMRSASGRYTGMLHLSAGRVRFSEETRQFIMALEPPLARITDSQAIRLQHLALGGGLPAALVTPDGSVTGLDDHPRFDVERDPLLLRVILQFLVCEVAAAQFLWLRGPNWFRMQLVRADVAPWRNPRAVVVAEAVDPPYGLTTRELDVLTLLAAGATNQAIAARLVVSPRTVSTHVERILGKLGCGNRAAAAARATREGLVKLWIGSDGGAAPALSEWVLPGDWRSPVPGDPIPQPDVGLHPGRAVSPA